jgi:hypothetical protein
MTLFRPLILVATVAAFCFGLISPASGQKPSAPPYTPPPPPTMDVARWAQAYKDAGRPVMLTLVGFATGDKGAETVEKELWSVDETGFTQQLRSAFNEFINDPSVDLEMVSPNALKAAVNRLGENLDIRRERAAVELLSTETNADLVVVIRLFGDRGAGFPSRGQLECFDSRGRERGSYPFDWAVRDTSTQTIRAVANGLAILFTNDFIKRAGAPQRYTIRLFGLADVENFAQLRETLESNRAVAGVKARRGSAGGGDAYREIEVTTALDQLDLETVVTRAVRKMELDCETFKAEGAAINLRIKAKAKPGQVVEADRRPCRDAVAEVEDPDGKFYRRQLSVLYENKRRPSIAVMVNRRNTPVDNRVAQSKGEPIKGENVIIIQNSRDGANSAGGGGATPVPANPAGPEQSLDADFATIKQLNILNLQLEGHIFDLFGTELLDFGRRIDPAVARENILKGAANQQATFAETELAALMRQRKIADYLIEGIGTLSPEGGTVKMRYTFKMYNRNGELVSTVPDVSGDVGFNDPTRVLTVMAREAVSKIACELLQEWRKPNLCTVMLKGAQDFKDYLAIEKVYAAETQMIRIVGDAENNLGKAGGAIIFTMSYDPTKHTFSDVQREIIRLNDKLPGFTLKFESGESSAITLEIQR